MPRIEEQFTAFFRRKQAINFHFGGEDISSDAGALLFHAIERKTHIIKDFAKLIPDLRNQSMITYTYGHMLGQRILLMAQGYQDCNDSAYLHDDPVVREMLGGDLCSQPTLSRLENTMDRGTIRAISEAWVDRYVSSIKAGRKQVVIDIDSTDDPAHGGQQMVMFNGFHNQFQLDQLLFFDGETKQMILPVLRPGNSHTAYLAFAILRRIIGKIRAKFPDMRIVVRADSGYSCPEFYKLAKDYKLVFALGIPANPRLKAMVGDIQREIKEGYVDKGERFQFITDGFEYKADSWEDAQTVYAKIESTGKGLNTRFFISNMEEMTGDRIYWDFYVQRGETCENRIKEFKNMCHSGRLSCHGFWANNLRMFMSAIVYEMFRTLKDMIAKTTHEEAKKWQVDNLRLFLLKVGATVKRRVRTVTIRFSQSFAQQILFRELMEMG